MCYRMNLIPTLLFIGIFLFSLLSFFVNTNAQELKPNALISPTCSDVEGSRINLHVNGFEPDSFVGWKLVNPETQTMTAGDGSFLTTVVATITISKVWKLDGKSLKRIHLSHRSLLHNRSHKRLKLLIVQMKASKPLLLALAKLPSRNWKRNQKDR